jgi:hypothetical protein
MLQSAQKKLLTDIILCSKFTKLSQSNVSSASRWEKKFVRPMVIN